MNISAIILAGGKSARFEGQDKALLEIEGRTFLERIVAAAKPVSKEIIIISPNNYDLETEIKIYDDLIPNCGPLGGIFTGLSVSSSEYNFTLSCDLPFINTELLSYLYESCTDNEITIVQFNNRINPLCGIYASSIKNKLEALLKNGTLKMHEVIKNFDTKVIDINDSLHFYDEKILVNINDPEEYKRHLI